MPQMFVSVSFFLFFPCKKATSGSVCDNGTLCIRRRRYLTQLKQQLSQVSTQVSYQGLLQGCLVF